MTMRNLAIVSLTLGVLGSCTYQSVQAEPAEVQVEAVEQVPAFIHDISDIKPDPGVTYGVLENGLRYAVMENDTPSGTASLHMRFATGSINETEPQRGLAHFLEHMAFNGTKNVPEGEMIKRLERYGLSFGADTNAHTGFDETVYKLNLPTLEAEVLDEAFFLMLETAKNMTLDPDAIERERGVIHSEKRTRDSAAFQRLVHQIGFFTKGTGLVERMPIGTDETIESMQAEDFVAYYRDYYHPENTFVVFVGDMPAEDIIARIEETFSDWQPETSPAAPRELTPSEISPGDIGYYSDPKITTSVQLLAVQPYTERVDTVAQRKKDFLGVLANSALARRMRTLADEPGASFLASTVNRVDYYKTMQGNTLSVRGTPDSWEEALAAGEQEIRRALAYGFSQAEVDEQVAKSRASLKQAVEGANSRPTTARTGGLVRSIVNAHGNERVFSHPADALARFEAYADDITAADLTEAFRKNWAGFESPVVYLSTSKVIEDPETAIAAAVAKSQAVPVSEPEGVETLIFPYTDFGTPGEIVSETYVESVDAYLVKFANNVMLNFKQTDFQEGLVFMKGNIGDGSLSMPRKDEGLRRLALNLLMRGGYEALSLDDLERVNAGKRLRTMVRVWPGSDALSMDGFSTVNDFDDAMNQLAAHVTAPGYRERAKERYLDSLTDWFPTHDATPSGVASRYLPRMVRSGDGRFGFSDLESFTSATTEEVRAWVDPQLESGVLELTIVGDIDKDTVVAEVARTFGALPTRETDKADYPEMTSLSFPAGNDEPIVLRHAGEDNQALFRIYWPAPDASDVIVTRQMRVLQSIFRNRLVDEIREGEAAAYSPGVGRHSSRTYPDYGYIFVSLDLTPEKVMPMREKTLAVAASLQAQEITQDEFERAITPIIEDLDANLESNGFWLRTLGDAQTDGWGLSDFATREQTYREMNIEDVKTLAASVFDNSASYSVVILPEEKE